MSTVNIGLDAADLQGLQAAFAQAPDIVLEELNSFLQGAVLHLQSEVQERTPTAYGTLRQSIIGSVQPIEGGLGVEGVVGSALSYAEVVELGSKPHRPPIEPLIDWARKKFALSETEAKSAAWGIAGHIANHGTLAVGMFHRTMAANRDQFNGRVRDMLIRIMQRIGHAT